MRRKSWSVWERPVSCTLWSRVSFLLFLSSYHLKDLPNKSIMLNEPGEEWQGLQLSVQNNTADVLDKHTHQGTSCFSLPIAPSQDCFSLPKVMILHIIQSSHCPLSKSWKSRLRWWILLIFPLLSYLSCYSCTWKKNPFFSSAVLPNCSFNLWLG